MSVPPPVHGTSAPEIVMPSGTPMAKA